VLHVSQNTMRLFDGSTSRWHILHLAASRALVDFLRLTPWDGSGRVGTNATGCLMFRPDFVRVGSGVYESEMSELSLPYSLLDVVFAAMVQRLTSSSSSLSPRFRLPPLPPRPPLPRPRPRPRPDPRPDEPQGARRAHPAASSSSSAVRNRGRRR
jgi:hypothetical protein